MFPVEQRRIKMPKIVGKKISPCKDSWKTASTLTDVRPRVICSWAKRLRGVNQWTPFISETAHRWSMGAQFLYITVLYIFSSAFLGHFVNVSTVSRSTAQPWRFKDTFSFSFTACDFESIRVTYELYMHATSWKYQPWLRCLRWVLSCQPNGSRITFPTCGHSLQASKFYFYFYDTSTSHDLTKQISKHKTSRYGTFAPSSIKSSAMSTQLLASISCTASWCKRL